MAEKTLKLSGHLVVKQTGEIELHGCWPDLKKKLNRFDGRSVLVTLQAAPEEIVKDEGSGNADLGLRNAE
jgi:hypothetical protein